MKLIALIEEGQKIASDAVGGKAAKGFRERYAVWSKEVRAELKHEPLTLARFTNSPPISGEHPGVPFGHAVHWRKLRGQIAVLIEIAKEEPEALTLNPGFWGMNYNLKVEWRRLRSWWSKR